MTLMYTTRSRMTENLSLIFTVRENRKVSKSLTVQYDRMLYLIEDSEFSRRIIGKFIDVYHYPDAAPECTSLPYSVYDRLSEIDQGVLVDNKGLRRALELIGLAQGVFSRHCSSYSRSPGRFSAIRPSGC